MERHQILYINGRFLAQELTGVQRFANELLKEYFNLKKSHTTIILAPPNCPVESFHRVEVKKIGYNINHLWEQIDLPLFLKRAGNPLLLNLTNTAPLRYNNQVVTIHDLAFLYNPKWFSFGFRTYYKFLIPLIARKAKHIITVSEFSKSEITKFLSILPEKISVIYNSVPSKFHHTKLKERNQKERYALAVGSLDPRKNLFTLIKAFDTLEENKLMLYIIGSSNPKIFKNKLPKYNSEKIKFIGRVSDEELMEYYANAEMFIYPTLYEGFGIPNIEAMHFSTAVLTSDIPVIREICKDAAFYIDPLNLADIQRGISTLEGDKGIKDKLSVKGRELSSSYTWNNACKILLDVIENATQFK